MKKIKPAQIVNVVLIVVSTMVLLWMLNLMGFSAFCRWVPFYNNIFVGLWLFDLLLLILFILSILKLKKEKITKIFKLISLILSSIFTLIMLGSFIFLVSPGLSKVESGYTLNELGNNTLINSEGPISLAVASDPHWGSERSNKEARQQIIENIGSSNYDAFLCLGDISEMGSTEANYKTAVKAFQENLNETPLHVVLGNHDALINGTGVFKKYFQKDKENFYNRIDLEGLHIITLNLLWDAEEFDKTQKQWLIEQLEDISQDDITIVLSHCFGYSSGYLDQDTGKNWFDNPDVIEEVDSLIEKYNVELMISGHNHLMELLKHENTHYAVIGTMGGILDSVSNYTSPQSIWMNNQTYGWLDIQVYQNYLELTYKDQSGKDIYKATLDNN